ncbi:TPA: cupin domain-containing protein [Vibrio parahaemolyticus]|uniref:cupin domain-containing protein n=1 Tax=Vibrio parahaemolyticus TaxID=670 RepID=UPI001120E846|nr:cupin domain-containing protein [Vibrio parahaemolyticus]EIC9816426.1 cupin domain-containing protein [Vibrio alginolyticus]EIF2704619.1 cupin domain-containing protein [Vibrio alginolyticus]EJV0608091.1 cupin domain-containing protein [Vibrio parahaemolyticus]EKA7416658.1 cupin domain-containing protein [Vibrio parahaemolyticus]ELA6773003.1 cupin domain-containing protein [Vibrio alginolyticus]
MEKILNIPSENWTSPTGFDLGIEQMIIEDTLDTEKKTGIRTRFVRFNSGAGTKEVFLHDYHEEVYLVSGDQILLDKDTFELKHKYTAGEYFIRPAGTHHGPFKSDDGCVLLEIHYY